MINHIDGNRLNNRADNLEWVTYSENVHHAYKIGLVKVGCEHPMAKLTAEDINYIRAHFQQHGLVDYAFETAGVPFLKAQVLELVKKKGTVVYVGTVHGEVKFPAKTFEKILRGELNIWQKELTALFIVLK